MGSLLQALRQAYGSRLEITFFPLSAKCKWAFFISNNSCLQGVDKNIKQRNNLGMKPVVANVSGVGADFFFLGDEPFMSAVWLKKISTTPLEGVVDNIP